MSKRYRIKPQKAGELSAYWGVSERGQEPDVVYNWGEGCARADARLLHSVLSTERPYQSFEAPFPLKYDKSLCDELEARGYDLRTLKFSIRKRVP